jgi:hypothetical protein
MSQTSDDEDDYSDDSQYLVNAKSCVKTGTKASASNIVELFEFGLEINTILLDEDSSRQQKTGKLSFLFKSPLMNSMFIVCDPQTMGATFVDNAFKSRIMLPLMFK